MNPVNGLSYLEYVEVKMKGDLPKLLITFFFALFVSRCLRRIRWTHLSVWEGEQFAFRDCLAGTCFYYQSHGGRLWIFVLRRIDGPIWLLPPEPKLNEKPTSHELLEQNVQGVNSKEANFETLSNRSRFRPLLRKAAMCCPIRHDIIFKPSSSGVVDQAGQRPRPSRSLVVW